VNREGIVENLQFWIREDCKYNYSILRRILDMMSKLEIVEPFSEVIEKDIFRAYQETFDIETLTRNYTLKTDTFNTKKVSNSMKPHRNFIKSSKESINIFIKNYIEKGEK
jgi:hypothetical protein